MGKENERRKILTQEKGVAHKSWGGLKKVALIYPNTYKVGMSNLGIHILYREMNSRADTVCERFFMPDNLNESSDIRSIESGSSLKEFDILAFALSFEIDGFHLVEILRQGGLEIFSRDRFLESPFVLLGGPCATFNPEPWADFVDGVIIGEGERVLHQILDNWNTKLDSHQDQIENLSNIEGLYFPSCYEESYDEEGVYQGLFKSNSLAANVPCRKQWVKDLDEFAGHGEIVTPNTEFGHMFLIEVARGCGRHCRFCMAGYAFRKPRVRRLEEIKAAVLLGKEQGAKQIGLVGAAVSDYPQIDELCQFIDEQGLDLSVASLRADNVSETLVRKLVKSGQRTITFAPETGSERMRKVINKGLSESDLLSASIQAIQLGMKHVRLYGMLGLPEETDEDVWAFIELARKIRQVMKENHHAGKVVLSVNPFIPKPFTPFEKLPLFNTKEIEKKMRLLQKELPKHQGYEVKAESLREAWVQGILARGDRRLSEVIAQCGIRGYREFAQKFRKRGLEVEKYTYQDMEKWKALPWSHIDIGVSSEYLATELEKAKNEELTAICFDGCKRCGVCT